MTEQQTEYIKDAMEMIGMETPRQIVTEVSGFTPMFDAIVQEYQDETIAAVFGAIWRYCQMQDGICRASLDTIASTIGVNKATVMRHADRLCEDGYIKDLTPELRNRPHIYAETGRIQIKSKFETVAQRNTTVAQRNTTVAQSKLSKDLKKDIKKDERYSGFSTATSKLGNLRGGSLNSIDVDYLNDWTGKHTEEWIGKAIEIAQAKGARSSSYVDKILLGWEANGYPKTRDQQIAERKGTKPNGTHQQNNNQPEHTDADRAIAARIKAQRAAADLQRV